MADNLPNEATPVELRVSSLETVVLEKFGTLEEVLAVIFSKLNMVSERGTLGGSAQVPMGTAAEASHGGDAVRAGEKDVPATVVAEASLSDESLLSKWLKQARKDVQSLKVVMFDGSDWLSWRITVELQLGQVGMMGYLTSPRPLEAAEAAVVERWNGANALLRSYLLDRLSPSVRRTVITHHTAKATWESLEEQWGGNTVAAHEDLLDAWEDFAQGPKDTMREYIDNLNHLVLKVEYSKIEDHVSDVRKRHKLLRGMDSQWSHLKDIVKLSDMGYGEACKRLLETGKREGDGVEPRAFVSRRSQYRPNGRRQGGAPAFQRGPCYICEEMGHIARDCPKGLRAATRGGGGQGAQGPSTSVDSPREVATPSAAK